MEIKAQFVPDTHGPAGSYLVRVCIDGRVQHTEYGQVTPTRNLDVQDRRERKAIAKAIRAAVAGWIQYQ